VTPQMYCVLRRWRSPVSRDPRRRSGRSPRMRPSARKSSSLLQVTLCGQSPENHSVKSPERKLW
jgi:hypothetical protein